MKQHLDSFNYFVNIGIKKIVRANDRIVSTVDPGIYLRYPIFWSWVDILNALFLLLNNISC